MGRRGLKRKCKFDEIEKIKKTENEFTQIHKLPQRRF